MSKITPKKRADEELLGELHFEVATQLIQKLRDGNATPQDFKNAIQFLKDNLISGEVLEDTPLSALKELSKTIPFPSKRN